jgi:hypothetical protein
MLLLSLTFGGQGLPGFGFPAGRRIEVPELRVRWPGGARPQSLGDAGRAVAAGTGRLQLGR